MISTNFPAKLEDTQGVNLVSDGDTYVSNSNFLMHLYTLSEPIELNTYYTILLSGILGEGKTSFWAYAGTTGRNAIAELKRDNNGFYYASFRLSSYINPNDNPKFLAIYAREYDVTGVTSKIYNVKLEKGYNPNPIYTQSPTDQLFHALDPIPEMHRNLYRGRNLGESTQMSEAHKAAIQDGSFKDLFVGDYWTHDGINYRIADMDYWYNCGDTPFTTHHLVIVPDENLGENKPMNTSGGTENGYTGSDMYKTVLPSIKTGYVDAAFPSLVLTHKEYLTKAVTEGHPSGGGWFESTVELMNEIMVYGCPIFTPANTGTTVLTLHTIDNSQLALFQLNPRMIKTRKNYWMRDVVSASNFANVNATGLANAYSASNSAIGVRPVFCIGVAPASDETEDDMEVVGAVGSPERMEDDVE